MGENNFAVVKKFYTQAFLIKNSRHAGFARY